MKDSFTFVVIASITVGIAVAMLFNYVMQIGQLR